MKEIGPEKDVFSESISHLPGWYLEKHNLAVVRGSFCEFPSSLICSRRIPLPDRASDWSWRLQHRLVTRVKRHA